ncbi:haloacid dehalogenase type II [Metabacillus sp. RGM 3146]|uniref:haloacid dehalogenase type II n=1 Tax=Metabacillus sp. RGM 3146 TaxID=3401092 RepID=UPI003B9CE080
MTIKACLFDAYGTLFDVYSVKQKCEDMYPEKGEQISLDWREKQLEYAFLRQILQKYEPFDQITERALRAALDLHQPDYQEEDVKKLTAAYEELTPYEETKQVLSDLDVDQVFIYSNGTSGMLEPLLKNNGMESLIGIISADEAKQYKPAPAAYQYALEKLGLNKKEVLFVSSNQWDIAGASSFGFQTAWINRKEEPVSQLGFEPDKICSDLNGLL